MLFGRYGELLEAHSSSSSSSSKDRHKCLIFAWLFFNYGKKLRIPAVPLKETVFHKIEYK
jgi:hypothetical protein